MKPINFQLPAIAVPFGAGNSVILSETKNLPSEHVITGDPSSALQRPERMVEGPSQDDIRGALPFSRGTSIFADSPILYKIKTFAEGHSTAIKAVVLGALMAVGLVNEPGVSDVFGQMTLPLAFGIFKKIPKSSTMSPRVEDIQEMVKEPLSRISRLTKRLEGYLREEEITGPLGKEKNLKIYLKARRWGNILDTYNEIRFTYEGMLKGISGAIGRSMRDLALPAESKYADLPKNIRDACFVKLSHLKKARDITKKECEFCEGIGADVPEFYGALIELLEQEEKMLFAMGEREQGLKARGSMLAACEKIADIHCKIGNEKKGIDIYRTLATDHADMAEELLKDAKVTEAFDAYKGTERLMEKVVGLQQKAQDAEGLFMSRSIQISIFLDRLIGMHVRSGNAKEEIEAHLRKLEIIKAGMEEAFVFQHERFLSFTKFLRPLALVGLARAYLAIDRGTAARYYGEALEACEELRNYGLGRGDTKLAAEALRTETEFELELAKISETEKRGPSEIGYYNKGSDHALRDIVVLINDGIGEAVGVDNVTEALRREASALLLSVKDDMTGVIEMLEREENRTVIGEKITKMSERVRTVSSLFDKAVLALGEQEKRFNSAGDEGNAFSMNILERSIMAMTGELKDAEGDVLMKVCNVLAGADSSGNNMAEILKKYIEAKGAFEEALKAYDSSRDDRRMEVKIDKLPGVRSQLTGRLRDLADVLLDPLRPKDKVLHGQEALMELLQRIKAMYEGDDSEEARELVDVICSISQNFGRPVTFERRLNKDQNI